MIFNVEMRNIFNPTVVNCILKVNHFTFNSIYLTVVVSFLKVGSLKWEDGKFKL